ncbi:MAG: carbohydrate porin [Acidobacteriaceae bacterium]|nr:carbohydrate porin [Acidobacteriaceae bacterium]
MKVGIAQLSGSKNAVQNEKGSEVFYELAITPAFRVIPSYQHIWNPLTAGVARSQRTADVFLLRFAVTW